MLRPRTRWAGTAGCVLLFAAGAAAWMVSAFAESPTGTVTAGTAPAPGAAPAAAASYESGWWVPGSGAVLDGTADFDDPLGKVGLINAAGPIDTKGHPFFEPIGSNGRACVSCHQPAYGMSVSVQAIQARWKETQGKDPIFAAVDGSNCPSAPQAAE